MFNSTSFNFGKNMDFLCDANIRAAVNNTSLDMVLPSAEIPLENFLDSIRLQLRVIQTVI